MVRFRTDSDSSTSGNTSRRPIEDYRSRSAKYRLLVIVFSLMTVGVLIGKAFQPETWEWIAGQSQADPAPVEEDIDTRLVQPSNPSLPLGVFVSEVVPDRDDESQGKSELGLNLARYGAIKDNTVFRSAETSIWFDTLVAIRDWPADTEKPTASRVSFTQLYRQPELYRGHSVEVRGVVRRADYHHANKNEVDIDGYWQCWLRPPGSRNPIVVYALELPDGFATGEDIQEVTTFRGIFFKRWAYEANGGIMTAPVVLSHSLDWSPKVVAPPVEPPRPATIWSVVAAMVGLTTVIAIWIYQSSKKLGNSVDAYRDQDQEAQVAIGQLSQQDIPSEDDFVRSELARRETGDADG